MAHLWATNIKDSSGITDDDSSEFRVIEKLCSFQYMHNKVDDPIDVIVCPDDLDHLIKPQLKI